MTRKLSISLPDDIAAVLDGQENASAYIAEAIRRRKRSDDITEFFRAEGIEITDSGVASMRARLLAKRMQRIAQEAEREC